MFIGADSRTEIERPVSETVPLFWRFLDVDAYERDDGIMVLPIGTLAP